MGDATSPITTLDEAWQRLPQLCTLCGQTPEYRGEIRIHGEGGLKIALYRLCSHCNTLPDVANIVAAKFARTLANTPVATLKPSASTKRVLFDTSEEFACVHLWSTNDRKVCQEEIVRPALTDEMHDIMLECATQGKGWKERLPDIEPEPFDPPKRILVAVLSHRGGYEKRRIIRETWMSFVASPITARFFVGDYEGDEQDVVNLKGCGDAHRDIPEKIQAIVRWAIANGYDFMWKVDDDVQLLPASFMETQVGHVRPYLYKGFFYGLNVHAMEAVAQAALPVGNWDEKWIGDISMAHAVPVVIFKDSGRFFNELRCDIVLNSETGQSGGLSVQDYEPVAKSRWKQLVEKYGLTKRTTP